jgi:two-component system phosphate regulon sensor histidine kinase PhoR
MQERYEGSQSSHIVIGALLAFALFAVWEALNHVVLMELLSLPMFAYHAVSFGVETALAAAILILVARELIRKNRQLAEKSRRLEELDRQKNMLTMALVHDLRQPLTALLGALTSALQHGRLDEPTRKFLHIVQMGGAQLQAMVTDLLDVAALEAGQDITSREEIDPAGFIRAGVEDVGLMALERGVDLWVEVPDDLPLVKGDASKLRRVVMNLVDNAMKFSPSQSTVWVTAWADSEQERVLVSVRDAGVGIPEESREQVFERFATQERARPAGRRPSGLGLTFCKTIVEAHTGEIWVESEVGSGSTFTFSLPFAPDCLQVRHARAGEVGVGRQSGDSGYWI